jgi:hypothetical protein
MKVLVLTMKNGRRPREIREQHQEKYAIRLEIKLEIDLKWAVIGPFANGPNRTPERGRALLNISPDGY